MSVNLSVVRDSLKHISFSLSFVFLSFHRTWCDDERRQRREQQLPAVRIRGLERVNSQCPSFPFLTWERFRSKWLSEWRKIEGKREIMLQRHCVTGADEICPWCVIQEKKTKHHHYSIPTCVWCYFLKAKPFLSIICFPGLSDTREKTGTGQRKTSSCVHF